MLRLLATIFLLLAAGAAQATDDLLARFMAHSQPARAAFIQVDQAGETRGVLTVGKMGLRWEQYEPYPSLLVSNGKVAWQVDQDLRQATRMVVDANQGWAGAFGDRKALEAEYEVKQQGQRLTLTPRSDQGTGGMIEFDAQGNPVAIELGRGQLDLDPNATTRISFGQWTRLDNSDAKALFEYEPGAGIDVIGGSQPR